MNAQQPFRRWVLVDRREAAGGVRRLGLARVTGVLPVASCGQVEPAKPVAR